jgi:hypothetical protein
MFGPLDIKAGLEELTYALDKLNADGMTIFAHYGDGYYYLSREAFDHYS